MRSGLQWVHGQITVVMLFGFYWNRNDFQLQWVHGQITVVMPPDPRRPVQQDAASMGPRSDNRGYAPRHRPGHGPISRLQWVHGQITVVMPVKLGSFTMQPGSFNGSTVR